MFLCPGCGANIDFAPGLSVMKCPYCETTLSPEDEIKINYAHEESVKNTSDTSNDADSSLNSTVSSDVDVTLFTCSQCGGELLAYDDTAVTFCSYCGSSTPLLSRLTKQKAPSYIIPFSLTKNKCIAEYKKKIKKNFFAPKSLVDDNVVEKIRGIYMPYYIYEATLEKPVSGTATKSLANISSNTRTTSYFNARCTLYAQYDGISYDASSTFFDEMSSTLMPYNYSDIKSYEPNYFSGFYADTSDIDSEIYNDKVKDSVIERVSPHIVENVIEGYELINAPRPTKDDITIKEAKLAYFPVYFLANRTTHKGQSRVSYAAINGSTGKVYADMPISILKYIGVSLLIAALSFIILSCVTLVPEIMLGICMILSVISALFLNTQADSVYYHENGYLDAGYRSRLSEYEKAEANWILSKSNRQNNLIAFMKISFSFVGCSFLVVFLFLLFTVPFLFNQLLVPAVITYAVIKQKNDSIKCKVKKVPPKPHAPFKYKLKYLAKPLLCLAFALIVAIARPTHDLLYYVAATMMLIVLFMSISDILSQHNLLTSRKLPQLNKRGGDEYEI